MPRTPVLCMLPTEKSKRSKTVHYDPDRAEAFRVAMTEHPTFEIRQMFHDGRMNNDGDLMNLALEMAHDALIYRLLPARDN